MKKFMLLTLSVVLCFAACKKDDENPLPDNPETTPTDTTKTDTTKTVDLTNPNNYQFLKTYIDRVKHPGFKFSGALDVTEFNKNTNGVRDTVTAHFDEIVAGNAMKYGSVVNSSGKMNFSRVKRFVNDAKAAGLTIYGHTLAWHSQQQPGYLLGLMTNEEEPLTPEQKRDTLAWAMDRWIAGMMEATDGYVKAWDVVNEAISGGGNDGNGNYVLQNYENNNISDPSNVSSGVFYWQAFMGDLEYVRTAVASARKHFKGNADELKLFVNDYNLESDWDDNKKVKSLVGWIKKWEADGVTKIDGIGTQMHVSCFEDAKIQKNIENHVVKMFEIMAASGKLCRISELDMGYIRGNSRWDGKKLKTSELTPEEHKKMADFYEFIIKKYFEIIPVEQQYGICQWCLTDAPSNSGWRASEPVGIWTLKFKDRKAAYIGFANGLSN